MTEYFAYRVKTDFLTGDSSSLSVKKNEILLGQEKSLPSGQWILVQQSTPPFSHGYVPSDFIERCQDEAFLKRGAPNELPKEKKQSTIPNLRRLIVKRTKDVSQLIAKETGNLQQYEQQKWFRGVDRFDEKNFAHAASNFITMKAEGITAKISYNIGSSYQMLAKYDIAIFYFSQSILLDPWFAISYFSRGTCYFQGGDPFQAFLDFNFALDILKENTYIDYVPLGLDFILTKTVLLYNRALCFAAGKKYELAIMDLTRALQVSNDGHQSQVVSELLRNLANTSHPNPPSSTLSSSTSSSSSSLATGAEKNSPENTLPFQQLQLQNPEDSDDLDSLGSRRATFSDLGEFNSSKAPRRSSNLKKPTGPAPKPSATAEEQNEYFMPIVTSPSGSGRPCPVPIASSPSPISCLDREKIRSQTLSSSHSSPSAPISMQAFSKPAPRAGYSRPTLSRVISNESNQPTSTEDQ